MPDLTPLQQAILHTKRENPGASPKEISSSVGCSPSYVSQVLRDHGGWELDQMEGEPVTAEDIDRDYVPPHDRNDEWWVVLMIALALVIWYLASNGFV